uniref:Uncharacterized protein n=1 Tax=Molossus molossus TaxID=27622 RepID=A0A7J8HCS2_MOLMO|nr:hypothetical protein HJG59_011121 [Molossus molossus]
MGVSCPHLLRCLALLWTQTRPPWRTLGSIVTRPGRMKWRSWLTAVPLAQSLLLSFWLSNGSHLPLATHTGRSLLPSQTGCLQTGSLSSLQIITMAMTWTLLPLLCFHNPVFSRLWIPVSSPNPIPYGALTPCSPCTRPPTLKGHCPTSGHPPDPQTTPQPTSETPDGQ